MAPVRPSAARIARLAALAAAHDAWVAERLPGAEFRPEGRRPGSDYNQHYLDVNPSADAEDDFQRRARQAMGLDPQTGRRPS
ncbi:hypothetical protein Ssi03_50620 [Sphaerisporangium siamense]|uniref:Uncharacterized protein n=1 Tax=Sphaerisporangium siamense TaxID=795645 RepID=A0A7W7GBA0_9ACTN|nr:hypothetical protein [Sphaerisporangium siamense]MBB4702234.1 hypothetical protein [Sphaerisporangium siamense]GII87072.1 hypothetical protein Ssi03_50620 [Sphaerisporangium siamense]